MRGQRLAAQLANDEKQRQRFKKEHEARRRQLTRNPKKLKQSLNHLYQNRLKSPNLVRCRRPKLSPLGSRSRRRR